MTVVYSPTDQEVEDIRAQFTSIGWQLCHASIELWSAERLTGSPFATAAAATGRGLVKAALEREEALSHAPTPCVPA